MVNLLRRIPKRDLSRVYTGQLFANEVMLLPYYIAALNIEHAYYERTGSYEPFDGLCFVDTLDLAEEGGQGQFSVMTEENTARVERQNDHAPCIASGLKLGSVSEREETDDEAEPVYGSTDHRDAARASGREVCGRSVPQARELGGDI